MLAAMTCSFRFVPRASVVRRGSTRSITPCSRSTGLNCTVSPAMTAPAFGAAHRADESPHGAFVAVPRRVGDDAIQAGRRQDAAGAAIRFVDGAQHAGARIVLGGDNRAMAGQIAFAADSLDARQVDGIAARRLARRESHRGCAAASADFSAEKCGLCGASCGAMTVPTCRARPVCRRRARRHRRPVCVRPSIAWRCGGLRRVFGRRVRKTGRVRASRGGSGRPFRAG